MRTQRTQRLGGLVNALLQLCIYRGIGGVLELVLHRRSVHEVMILMSNSQEELLFFIFVL